MAPRAPVFDHTSIIRTILERFCAQPGGGIPAMTRRVQTAASLWPLLNAEQPRPAPLDEIDALVERAADRQRETFVRRRTVDFRPDREPTLELDDLQREIVSIVKHLRDEGLPANKA